MLVCYKTEKDPHSLLHSGSTKSPVPGQTINKRRDESADCSSEKNQLWKQERVLRVVGIRVAEARVDLDDFSIDTRLLLGLAQRALLIRLAPTVVLVFSNAFRTRIR
jgi:hypothetical protein